MDFLNHTTDSHLKRDLFDVSDFECMCCGLSFQENKYMWRLFYTTIHWNDEIWVCKLTRLSNYSLQKRFIKVALRVKGKLFAYGNYTTWWGGNFWTKLKEDFDNFDNLLWLTKLDNSSSGCSKVLRKTNTFIETSIDRSIFNTFVHFRNILIDIFYTGKIWKENNYTDKCINYEKHT